MLFHSGTRPTRRIQTREGYALSGTMNHPVLTLGPIAGVPVLQWRLLSEVEPGERVVLLRRRCPDLGLLTTAEEDLAVLAGAWIAEGFVSQTRAGFNNIDEEYFRSVTSAYDNVVGGARDISERTIKSGSRLFELDVHDLDHLRRSPLSELTGRRSAEKQVPSFVWNASSAFKALFLRALFECDGSTVLGARSSIQITYSTRSETLGRDVQSLLLEFGVVSRRLHSPTTGEWKVVISNRRDARIFAEHVGFLGRKQARLERQLVLVPPESSAMSSDHIPFIAGYIRADGASRWTEREWLSRHNVDRTERWERDGEEILDRITNDEVVSVIAPLVTADYF